MLASMFSEAFESSRLCRASDKAAAAAPRASRSRSEDERPCSVGTVFSGRRAADTLLPELVCREIDSGSRSPALGAGSGSSGASDELEDTDSRWPSLLDSVWKLLLGADDASTVISDASSDSADCAVACVNVESLAGVVCHAPSDAAVGGGVLASGGVSMRSRRAIVSSLSCARRSSDLSDDWPVTDCSRSAKSPPPMEKRIGGSAGAMNVEWEMRSTGEDSPSDVSALLEREMSSSTSSGC